MRYCVSIFIQLSLFLIALILHIPCYLQCRPIYYVLNYENFSEIVYECKPKFISKYGTGEICIILQLTVVFVLATLCQQRPFSRSVCHVSFSGIW